jgi:hypothetical protein
LLALASCLVSALLICSCSRPAPAPPAARSAAADRLADPVPPDRYPDDVGRFLAGLPARPRSALAGLHDTSAWTGHSRELDRAWSRLDAQMLTPARAFEKQSLAPLAISRLYYPFSGPDALMATTFFPAAKVYVLVGLEPAGTLPDPKHLARRDLPQYLARERASMASELGRSFFVTRQMDRQFRGQVTDGLFQPILHLLVRTGHTILGFRYVRLDDAGRLVERAAGYHTAGVIGNKGIELDFRTDADSSVHKLIYLSVNLSDERLHEDQPFLDFVSTLKGSTTFLKATSYMLHKPGFSMVRDQILTISSAVLQDDSGIPYRYFAPPAWHVELYGDYVRPYGSFRWLEQADLRQAYRAGAQPLAFRIGYGYGKVPSNLLLATRAKP